jgi:hypothetical protein
MVPAVPRQACECVGWCETRVPSNSNGRREHYQTSGGAYSMGQACDCGQPRRRGSVVGFFGARKGMRGEEIRQCRTLLWDIDTTEKWYSTEETWPSHSRSHLSAWQYETPHDSSTVNHTATFSWECLDHAPYSPDRAPSNFHFFPTLKRTLEGWRFTTNEDVEAAVRTFVHTHDTDFYQQGFFKLVKRWDKCINVSGDYIEKQPTSVCISSMLFPVEGRLENLIFLLSLV